MLWRVRRITGRRPPCGRYQPAHSARIYAVPAAAEAAGWTTGYPTQQRLVRYAGHVFNSGEEIPYKKKQTKKRTVSSFLTSLPFQIKSGKINSRLYPVHISIPERKQSVYREEVSNTSDNSCGRHFCALQPQRGNLKTLRGKVILKESFQEKEV